MKHKPQVPRHLKSHSTFPVSGVILRMKTADVISINLPEENSAEYLFSAHATLVRG